MLLKHCMEGAGSALCKEIYKEMSYEFYKCVNGENIWRAGKHLQHINAVLLDFFLVL